MRLINTIYFLLPFLANAQIQTDTQFEKNLFVCYGKINPEEVKGYATIILEAQYYDTGEIQMFKDNNEQVLGYLSLTEVNESAFFYEDIKPYTYSRNQNWGSCYINLESIKARNVLIDAASKLMEKGISGLFLDNLDNVSKWGKMPNQKTNLLRLIAQLKNGYKSIFLMQNSGLFLDNELRNITDAILVESVYTSYDFSRKQYAISNEADQKLKLLKKIKNKPIFILEYAEDEKMKNEVEKELKKLGHPYFIANMDLQTLPKFKSN